MSLVITRILKLRDGHDVRDVSVRIFRPIADAHGWECRWEIDWPDRRRGHAGRGVDAIQALGHALQMTGTEIYCSEEHRLRHLTWTDDWTGYGFPVPANMRDLLIGDDATNL